MGIISAAKESPKGLKAYSVLQFLILFVIVIGGIYFGVKFVMHRDQDGPSLIGDEYTGDSADQLMDYKEGTNFFQGEQPRDTNAGASEGNAGDATDATDATDPTDPTDPTDVDPNAGGLADGSNPYTTVYQTPLRPHFLIVVLAVGSAIFIIDFITAILAAKGYRQLLTSSVTLPHLDIDSEIPMVEVTQQPTQPLQVVYIPLPFHAQ